MAFHRTFAACLVLAGVVSADARGSEPAAPGPVAWRAWSGDVFDHARRENRFVLLDLEAVWCHWCHVMDETTYRDPDVVRLLGERYLAVRVDQDARPDLSNRYEDYGWPATIVFAPDGTELVKRSGYIPPPRMAALLQAVIDDPTPGPSIRPEPTPTFAEEGSLPAALRARLERIDVEHYDRKRGGWGFGHKFLDWDSVEYALSRARTGDAAATRRARQTLEAQRALLDPAWGGVYQYSTGGVWTEPHFEKLMAMQAGNLRVYSLAFGLFGDARHRDTAAAIRRYLATFLTSPEGAFYTSQDADVVAGSHAGDYFRLSDAARRARGVPRVDTHRYARENGWAISALVTYAETTGAREALDAALRAANWVLANRSRPGGGFSHDERDAAGPYLGDTLAMGRAFLDLYGSTGERAWLARASDALAFIAATFRAPGGAGFATAAAPPATGFAPKPQRDENVALARFANLLFRHTGEPAHRDLAREAMRFLSAEAVATRRPVGGVLLADLELRSDPVHLTVVGPRADPATRALHAAAASWPSGYKRVDLQDPSEPPAANAGASFPELDRPAAFVCAGGRCSLPVFEPDAVRARVDRLSGTRLVAARRATRSARRR